MVSLWFLNRIFIEYFLCFINSEIISRWNILPTVKWSRKWWNIRNIKRSQRFQKSNSIILSNQNGFILSSWEKNENCIFIFTRTVQTSHYEFYVSMKIIKLNHSCPTIFKLSTDLFFGCFENNKKLYLWLFQILLVMCSETSIFNIYKFKTNLIKFS